MKIIDKRPPCPIKKFSELQYGDCFELNGKFYQKINWYGESRALSLAALASSSPAFAHAFALTQDAEVIPIEVELHIVG